MNRTARRAGSTRRGPIRQAAAAITAFGALPSSRAACAATRTGVP